MQLEKFVEKYPILILILKKNHLLSQTHIQLHNILTFINSLESFMNFFKFCQFAHRHYSYDIYYQG